MWLVRILLIKQQQTPSMMWQPMAKRIATRVYLTRQTLRVIPEAQTTLVLEIRR